MFSYRDLLTDDSAILVKTSQADNTEALRVAQVIVHPRYNNTRMSTYLQHDIAVLRLQRPIVQSIIELPKSSFTALSLETVASVAGYGLIARTGEPLRYDLLSEIPHKLQETRVKVMDTTQCRARWPAMTMTNGMFCTYRSLNDVCVVRNGSLQHFIHPSTKNQKQIGMTWLIMFSKIKSKIKFKMKCERVLHGNDHTGTG